MGYLDDFKAFMQRKPISDPDVHPDAAYTTHAEEKRFQSSPTGRMIRELEAVEAQQDTSVNLVSPDAVQTGNRVDMSVTATKQKPGEGQSAKPSPKLDTKDYRKPNLPTGPIDIQTGEPVGQAPVLSYQDIERSKAESEQNRQAMLKKHMAGVDATTAQAPPTAPDVAFNLLDYPGHVVRSAIADHIEKQTGVRPDPEHLTHDTQFQQGQDTSIVTDLVTNVVTDPLTWLPVIGLPVDAYKAGGRAIKGAYEGVTDVSKSLGVDLAGQRGSMYGKELTKPLSEVGKAPTFKEGGALTASEQKEYEALRTQDSQLGTLTEEEAIRLRSLQEAVDAHKSLQLPAPSEPQPEIPVFYSPTERLIEAKMPKSAAPEQIMGIIRSGGIPQDEAKWMDLEGFMKGKQKLGKDEVLNYIKAHRFQLEEVRLGEKDPNVQKELEAWQAQVNQQRAAHEEAEAQRRAAFEAPGEQPLPEDAQVFDEDEFTFSELENIDSDKYEELREAAYDQAREAEESSYSEEWHNAWDDEYETVEDSYYDRYTYEFEDYAAEGNDERGWTLTFKGRFSNDFSDLDEVKQYIAENVAEERNLDHDTTQLAIDGGEEPSRTSDTTTAEDILEHEMDDDARDGGYFEDAPIVARNSLTGDRITGNDDIGWTIEGDRRGRSYSTLEDAKERLLDSMWDNFEVSDGAINEAEDDVFKDYVRDLKHGNEELPEGVYVRGINYEQGFAPRRFQEPQMPWELRQKVEGGPRTHYESYKLPGGKNYREFLLKVPETGYSAPHFGSESKDLMLHFRVSEREVDDPNAANLPAVTDGPVVNLGRKQRTLMVEEIQSDLHQQGRKKGYKDPNAQAKYQELGKEWDALEAERRGEVDITDERAAQIAARQSEITDAMNELQDAKSDGVPDLPFKKDWAELAIKRIIRLAAEEGFDRIAWTTGKQQAKRYNLSTQLDELIAAKSQEGLGGYMLSGTKNGRSTFSKIVDEKDLEDYVGVELAAKIRAQGSGTKQTYSGLDLEVGGSGMKGFYDEMLPKIVSKYTKKWGSKVEDVQITTDEAPLAAPTKETVHSIPVSPQMAEAVLNNPQSLMGSTFQTLEEHFKTLPKMVQEELRKRLPAPKQFKKLADEGGYVAFGPVWMISRAILGSIAGAQFGDEENAIQNALIGAGVGALASPSMIAHLAEQIRGVKQAAGSAPKFGEAADLNKFLEARGKVPHQANLSPMDLPGLEAFKQSGGRVFSTPDYSTGYMLSKEGDLQSVYNGGPAGMGSHAVKDAVKRGAKTLDAFDGPLVDYYKKHGFAEKGRVPFDPAQAAPGTAEALGGTPDVVFMERATPISEFAEQYRQIVADARRGVRHDVDVAAEGDLLANVGKIDEAYVKGLFPGTTLNDAQTYALHKVLTQSGQKLLQMASQITDDASAQEFIKALWVHGSMLDPKRLGVEAEAGRALRMYGTDAPLDVQAMNKFLDQFSDLMGKMKEGMNPMMVAEMVKSFKDPEQMAVFAKNAVKPGLKDAFLGLWINALLSGPHTHVVNATSNAATLGWAITERQFAPVFGGNVRPGEAAAMIHGVFESFTDSLRLGYEVFKGGTDSGKVEMHHTPLFTEAGLTGIPGHALDYVSAFFQGMGGRPLAAADAFFKGIAFRAEVRARALREAYNVANAEDLFGKAARERINELYHQYMTDIPPDIAKDAEQFSAYVTMTKNLGPTGAWLQEGAAKFPAVKLVIPFVKAPTNVFKFANERTPWGLFSAQSLADLKAGGARADLAMARWSMGSMTMGAAALLAMDGIITGGGPDPKKFPDLRKDMQENGWMPYSINVSAAKRKALGDSTEWQKGDKFVGPFNRVEPIGSLFSMAADYVEIASNRKPDETLDEMGYHMVAATVKAMSSKTFIKGLSQTMLALSFPEEFLDKTLDRQAVSLVPIVGSSLSRRITQQADPIIRHAEGFIEELKKNTPGLSKTLPAERNRWGEPVYRANGIGPDIASPFAENTYKKDRVIEALMKNKVNIPMAPDNLFGLPLTFEGKDELHQIIGKEVKKGGRDLHAAMDHLLDSSVFKKGSTGPDGRQALLLRGLVQEFTQRGEVMMLKRHPELKQALKDMYKAHAQKMKSVPTIPSDREIEGTSADLPDLDVAGN